LSSSAAAGLEKKLQDHNRHFTEEKMSWVYQRLRRTAEQKDAIHIYNSFRSWTKCYTIHVIEEEGEEEMIIIEVQIVWHVVMIP
jgi:hypothetical protein